jgi:hypothetical protein
MSVINLGSMSGSIPNAETRLETLLVVYVSDET